MKLFISLMITVLVCTLPGKAQGVYQFWGMTTSGGADNIGTIFNTDAQGKNFRSKFQLTNKTPGAGPEYTEFTEFNGKFYGLTSFGGKYGYGVIFEWDPATNEYIKKIDFNGQNGRSASGSLIYYSGKMYGMTTYGGNDDAGVIFEWDPISNIFNKMIDLNQSIGSNPYGKLSVNNDKFFGLTSNGGSFNAGVIFEWSPYTNIFIKKIDLNTNTGAYPFGSLTLGDDTFFGLTTQGGVNNVGALFEWDPVTNDITKRVDFTGSNGAYPNGSLTAANGKFYGMTYTGGANDRGVIFEWDPSSNQYNKKIDFFAQNGRNPYGNLTFKDDKFFGLTSKGGGTGSSSSPGVIFEWDPVSNIYTKKTEFQEAYGKNPYGTLAVYGDVLYGMTYGGGANASGVIFKWEPTSNVYTKQIDFNSSDGAGPQSSLSLYGNKYYGVTSKGGLTNKGVIFEYDPSANTYIKKIDFTGLNGSFPQGNMILIADKFYGMTKNGGSSSKGNIYEWNPATNQLITKKDLTNSSGSAPNGNLVEFGGKLYGVTSQGGTFGGGVIFEWDPVTNLYINKYNLTNSTGSYSYGSLSLFNGKFYGMTSSGGYSGTGVIFEWDPSSNQYTKMYDFGGSEGMTPIGNLTLLDGIFYGLTSAGGNDGSGVIFEWNPSSGDYIKRVDLVQGISAHPLGSLSFNAGRFYGMTQNGGTSGMGVIFEWNPVNNNFIITKNFNGDDGGNPVFSNDLMLMPAPVSKGVPSTCISFPSIKIDNSNNNIWVSIVDSNGDAVAEIKANGNNLGVVQTSMYINNGTIREDALRRLYLDRNITITPQVQPSTAVDIRLYIRNSEYLKLKNSVNSIGQPSAIRNINDVEIFKNNEGCLANILPGSVVTPSTTFANGWQTDFALATSIQSFSSFYFFNKAYGGPLPLTLLEFSGRLEKDNAALIWTTVNEINTQLFELERSTDGLNFIKINEVNAVNQPGNHKYAYSDKNVTSLRSPFLYYRLKQLDINGSFNYSGIVKIAIDNNIIVQLYPNPVTDKVNISFSTKNSEVVSVILTDNMGRMIKNDKIRLINGINLFSVDMQNLSKGIYYLRLEGDTIREIKSFSKL